MMTGGPERTGGRERSFSVVNRPLTFCSDSYKRHVFARSPVKLIRLPSFPSRSAASRLSVHQRRFPRHGCDAAHIRRIYGECGYEGNEGGKSSLSWSARETAVFGILTYARSTRDAELGLKCVRFLSRQAVLGRVGSFSDIQRDEDGSPPSSRCISAGRE